MVLPMYILYVTLMLHAYMYMYFIVQYMHYTVR